MSRKLLAMDLDGTAVADDYSLSLSSIEAIIEARKAGHVIVFISGRRDVDMLTLGEEQWCVDYHILNNGGKIIRCKDRKVIRNECIEEAASRKLIDYCLNNDLQLHIVNGMIWQVSKMSKRTMNYARKVGVIPEVFTSLDDVDTRSIEGFMATGDCDEVAAYLDDNIPEIDYVHSEPGTIDIMKAGVSKWNGIKALAEITGIEERDTIAAGNYYNDMDMVEKAGTGIAVANAVEELKQIADYVTINDNNHDAVKEMITKIMEGEFD